MTTRTIHNLSVSVNSLRSIDHREWDGFAIRAGGGLRAAAGYLRLLKLYCLFHPKRRLKAIEIFVGDSTARAKIGQATILQRPGAQEFVHRLLLHPDYAECWRDAFELCLKHLGRGDYEYGSAWSLEQAPLAAFKAIPGVVVKRVHNIHVQLIDFADFKDWDDYYSGVSNNIKRNVKRAEKTFRDLATVERHGHASWAAALTHFRLHNRLYKQKLGREWRLRTLLSNWIKIICYAEDSAIFVACAGGVPQATMSQVCFGDKFYCLEGAREPVQYGPAWFLQIEAIRRAFDAAPKGKFILGYVDFALHDAETSDGLLRARKALRAKDVMTQVVEFSYEIVCIFLSVMTIINDYADECLVVMS